VVKAAVIILFLLLPAIASGEPVIVFDDPVHDFGSVKEGDILQHTFQVSNSGTDDLLIEKVITS
jgi:HYDIN/CFA65/VesB-like, Ig-like domain